MVFFSRVFLETRIRGTGAAETQPQGLIFSSQTDFQDRSLGFLTIVVLQRSLNPKP